MRVVFVHGACVRDGAWWWHRAADLLRERGVPSVAPGLPSCGEAGVPGGAGGPGLAEDVAAVRKVLEDDDEPTVVVAHSYGGIVTAEAAAGVGSVRHLLLVSSYLPEIGQSLSDFGAVKVRPRSSMSTPRWARSASAPSCSSTPSCRTACQTCRSRRPSTWPGRACG